MEQFENKTEDLFLNSKKHTLHIYNMNYLYLLSFTDHENHKKQTQDIGIYTSIKKALKIYNRIKEDYGGSLDTEDSNNRYFEIKRFKINSFKEEDFVYYELSYGDKF